MQNAFHKKIDEMQEKFQDKFNNLANDIFDKKSKSFSEQSQKDLTNTLNPLKDNLEKLQNKIETSFETHGKEQYSLKQEINKIVDVNKSMTLEAKNLTNALKAIQKHKAIGVSFN